MSGSIIQITYDDAGTPLDITSDVLYEDASFEQQMNAVPGTFSFRVKDPEQTYDFVTGREVRLFVDDIPMFGGYLMRVSMTYPFSADNTSSPSTYRNRIWRLEGVDYNILFDNRIMRREDNYLIHLPNNAGYPKTHMDGAVLKTLLSTFCDFPTGFDITTKIDDIATVLPSTSTDVWYYKQQGTKIRDQFDEQAAWAHAVFYIGADKAVHYHAYETLKKRWGFSDVPNYLAITASPDDYQSATHGFREVSGTEDGTLIVNDSMVWGGGSPASEDILFARYQDAVGSVSSDSQTYVQYGTVTGGSSIDLHGRWQYAETHFSEEGSGYSILQGVKTRATQIINGPPGADAYGLQKGLRYPQWQFEFQWFADTVPLLSGDPDHIVAGDIVNIDLETFGVSEFMPCRTLRISFPGLDETGKAMVLLNGQFSLQYTDPIALWKTILHPKTTSITSYIRGVNNSSSSTQYGDYGIFTPYESPNGSRTVFSLRLVDNVTTVGYIMGTMAVYINGLLKRKGVDFTESDPANGEFTMTSAPAGGVDMAVTCRTLDN